MQRIKKFRTFELQLGWKMSPNMASRTFFYLMSPSVHGRINIFQINLASVWHPFGQEPWIAQLLLPWGHQVFFSPGSPPTWPCPWTCREAPGCCFPAWWSRCAASQSRSWLARWYCPWWSEGVAEKCEWVKWCGQCVFASCDTHSRGEDGRVVALQHALQLFVGCVSASWKRHQYIS